ncbi:hypothetical protein [Streptomyces spectabilis]|uniref:Uncharacterized protein n=1 Tax=Streptomyces spectabilis TaxID=68270 RepID=A0A516R0I1_STRST|nr:hypothetical protein [Streptomyces spectabilis]QDQ09161.1 hypothetical protein FH965_00080 [Streptomyces spectabilis]
METDLASVAVGVLAAALTGTATNVGQEAAAAVVRTVRERLDTTPRGRAALAGLAAAPDDAEARREAESILREETQTDPALRGTLTSHLSTSSSRTAGSVVINGSKIRGSQITLGPVTINKPSSTGGLLSLMAALAVVIGLLIYGGVRLAADDSPGTDDGHAAKARALSVAETEKMLPALTDLRGTWGTLIPPTAEGGGEGRCHQGGTEYRTAEGPSPHDLKLRFRVSACPNTPHAAKGYAEIVKLRQNPGGRKEYPFSAQKFGDESTTTRYRVEDETMADPSQVGEHLMARARVGTVVIEMHYGPIRDEAGSEREAAGLMRIMCDRAREIQGGG